MKNAEELERNTKSKRFLRASKDQSKEGNGLNKKGDEDNKTKEDLEKEIQFLNNIIKYKDEIIAEIKKENFALKQHRKMSMPINNHDIHLNEKVKNLERELEEQREENAQLMSYVKRVLGNIMLTNPHLLEKK